MRLYFHIRDPGGHVTEDPDGEEIDTFEQAKAKAEAIARELMIQSLRVGETIGLTRAVEVADESGKIVLTVRFRDAVL